MSDVCLGIDTSNYTTSVSLLDQHGDLQQQKRLLPVPKGALGLRHSDAVFHHTQQLPELLDALWRRPFELVAVGASVTPCDAVGSYMPCFTVGAGAAQMLARTHGVPLHRFSHQSGHIAAALYGSGKMELRFAPFLAFHVSGGTTEVLLVKPHRERIFDSKLVAASLDLKGGQAVDRVGGMLGLEFPAGKALETLALQWEEPCSVRPAMKGCDFSLSGVENQCSAMLQQGRPKAEIARFCLEYLRASLEKCVQALQCQYGDLPLLFAGGVMSNSILRDAFTVGYGAYFAPPVFSADNAAGIAVLTALKEGWF